MQSRSSGSGSLRVGNRSGGAARPAASTNSSSSPLAPPSASLRSAPPAEGEDTECSARSLFVGRDERG